ncbi:hypothetical protein FKP32DRAFT_769696 [Trametes sanguinea]|nr:hypothetical protein FKP32DRAFT_769696 [Trametes sanguinea]
MLRRECHEYLQGVRRSVGVQIPVNLRRDVPLLFPSAPRNAPLQHPLPVLQSSARSAPMSPLSPTPSSSADMQPCRTNRAEALSTRRSFASVTVRTSSLHRRDRPLETRRPPGMIARAVNASPQVTSKGYTHPQNWRILWSLTDKRKKTMLLHMQRSTLTTERM